MKRADRGDRQRSGQRFNLKSECHPDLAVNYPTHFTVRMRRHRKIQLVGTSVLVTGLIAALVIYLMARAGSGVQNMPDFSQDRRFNLELERIGGKSAVYVAAFDRWLSGLWHGTALAYTVVAMSVVVALVCFWLANLMSYPLTEVAQPRSEKSSEGQEI